MIYLILKNIAYLFSYLPRLITMPLGKIFGLTFFFLEFLMMTSTVIGRRKEFYFKNYENEETALEAAIKYRNELLS